MARKIRNLASRLAVCVAVMTASGVAHATVPNTSETAKVVEIQLTASYLWVRLDTAVVTDKYGCTNFNGYFRRTLTGEYKSLLAMAVTALTAGTEIQVRVEDCASYPQLDGIIMFPNP